MLLADLYATAAAQLEAQLPSHRDPAEPIMRLQDVERVLDQAESDPSTVRVDVAMRAVGAAEFLILATIDPIRAFKNPLRRLSTPLGDEEIRPLCAQVYNVIESYSLDASRLTGLTKARHGIEAVPREWLSNLWNTAVQDLQFKTRPQTWALESETLSFVTFFRDAAWKADQQGLRAPEPPSAATVLDSRSARFRAAVGRAVGRPPAVVLWPQEPARPPAPQSGGPTRTGGPNSS